MESVATNLLNDPDVGAIVLNARDVTDRRELGEKLVHNAFHDTLTNLPNLALFAEHLEGALSRVQAEQQAVVPFVDLDDFKNINDTLGHSAGDAALVLAADRLREVSPIGSTVARLAGDEFAVLMENLSLGFDLQRSVGDMLSQLGQPYVIGGSKLLVSASIGVAASGQGVYDAEELLRNADIAMYVAKKSGKARAAFYDPTMHDDIIDRLRLKADLGAAIERDEFLVLYQPVVALDGGEIVGVEALVRWIHPSRGMIAPLKFIPLAEENDLIVEIGRIVLTKACTQMAVWNLLRGAKQLSLNVNLSVRELIRDDLVDFVKATLDTTGLDPCCLVLEITETMLMAKLSSVAERFGELHALGVRIAIDDFGTGYSSLSYLENLPVDSIKIDKSFVDSLLKGENPVTLRTIIQLGNELKLKLVAEGIEEAMQAKSLIELGCEFGQGFHFARPLPPSEVEQLIFSPVAGSRNQNRVSQRFATEPIQEIVTKVTEGTQK